MVYFFTPLLDAGVVSMDDIDRIEIALARKQRLLHGDIWNKVIQRVCQEFYSSASKVCKKLARQNRLFVRKDDRVQSKKLKFDFMVELNQQ